MAQIKTLIDKLESVKMIKDALAKQLSTVTSDYKEAESAVIEALQEQGMTRGDNENINVFVTTSVVPQVTDWDDFYEFIFDNRYSHMLERRPAVLAFREFVHSGKQVPGVEPYEKVGLSVRKK